MMNAHNWTNPTCLPIYRFLGTLQWDRAPKGQFPVGASHSSMTAP